MEILRHYSKQSSLGVDLQVAAAQLKKALAKPNDRRRSVVSAGRVGKVWKLSDKVSEEDIAKIVEARHDGMAMKVIGRQFGISESSVKRILRRHRLGESVVELLSAA